LISKLPWLSLIIRRSRAEIHCPKFQRDLTSVHGIVAAVVRALPGFSPRLAFGCHPGTARQKSLPEISTRSYFGAWNCRGRCPGIARIFTATCFRLLLMRDRSETHCPVFHRDLLSVVAPTRRDKKSLPGFSPRLALGCRSGAAGQKIVARFFTAALLRLSLRRGQTKNHCPVFHRDLLSVVVRVRPEKNSLPETSARP